MPAKDRKLANEFLRNICRLSHARWDTNGKTALRISEAMF